MTQTRAERKAQKAQLREARRHAKEARNVKGLPQTGAEATTYATPAQTTGESVRAGEAADHGTELVTTGVVREWHQHAPESLPQIHEAIDSWGAKVRLDPAKVQEKVDKITKRVGSREVVVQETVTEWVERPAAPAPRTERHVEPVKAAKRKPRILGFFGPRGAKKAVDEAAAATQTTTGPATTADAAYQPQCSALTADGAQCRNSARGDSKYCISHKGYQPPTAKGIAKRVEGEAWDPRDKVTDAQTVRAANTRPKVRKAKGTRLSQRKAPKSAARKKR